MTGYIYKTTNIVNGRVYIGKHCSEEYDNKYYGSGTILCKAIEKYGLTNFTNEIICTANTIEELNQLEKRYIRYYKEKYGRKCYNIASGGDGGNVLLYANQEKIDKFIEKMTVINKERCASTEFREKISKATAKRMQEPKERQKLKESVAKTWESPIIREKQSQRLKEFYKKNTHDCSFNYKKCKFILGEIEKDFESIKELRSFLKEEYGYNPDRRTFQKIVNSGVPYVPFHKSNKKLLALSGMLIYRFDKGVTTNGDECSHVEAEISTAPKCEAISDD